MRILLLIIFLIQGLSTFAQKQNNVWCFGDSAGIDFNNLINPVPYFSGIDSRGSCTTISDTNGNLLFIAAGCPEIVQTGNFLSGKVYDKFSQIMQNGDSVIITAWYNEDIIVNDPSADSMYYVFHIGVNVNYGIYYSKVDLTQNAGLGAVTQKNVQLQSFPNMDCLNAIKHGNGRDWWVFFRRYDPSGFPTIDEFHSYLITPAGITNYTVQHVGSGSYTNLGKLTFSAQGDKLVLTSYAGLLEIYDFERCTGVISNPVNVFQEVTMPPANRFWGCEFSPNSNVLYVTISDQTSYLFQFDLTAANIAASIDTIWQTSYPTEAIGALKRGPDNKIYESGPYTNPTVFVYPYPDSMRNMYNENLGVINFPDSLGAACNFVPYSFYLGGKRTYWGLPNNPDYDMPAWAGSPCDSLITSTPQPPEGGDLPALFVAYVSSWQKLFINAQHLNGRKYTLRIFDAMGKIVYSSNGNLSPPYFTKDVYLPNLSAGVFIVSLVTEKESLRKKFVKD